ncbi:MULTISPECIES: ribosomal protein S18-alanine N-acetyltransferase [Methylocaldum]|jgi:ribosomal-protein-alanine N-acetyltransferase|uniref:ribosomal protein S18-alanine N-acetyltransferase n=1 Tax=unclassified Methylocaldum TaxID=2622260 RepID=UPI001B770537|nr:MULTISPECIES: ribosomal protein S18-alanine N-acetyltransferase [unclassified Methylocaldum]MBP1150972.1 ribosomal-protein-alanine N-acetyltransferase [Methylocaldum sp. RMAD-M]
MSAMFDLFGLFERIRKFISYDAETEFYYRHFPSLVKSAELIIRPMRRSDLKVVAAIEQSAYEFPWEPTTFRDCYTVGYCCWVGERAGQVVSYGIASVGAGESHVLNLCVSPQNQGQGYGRLMLEKLMAVAKEHKAETIFLEVRPSNKPAIKLYHQLGFNEIGTRKGYYPARNGREDALVMARML